MREIKFIQENRDDLHNSLLENRFKDLVYHIEENILSEQDLFLLRHNLKKIDESLVLWSKSPSSTSTKMNFHTNEKQIVDTHYNNCCNIIIEKTLDINDKIFNTDIDAYGTPKIRKYNKDQYLEWHYDASVFSSHRKKNINRTSVFKLSSVFSIGDDYEGGELQILCFNKNPEECIHSVKLAANTLIVFPSWLRHRVLPIKSGIRTTIQILFSGPQWK